MPTTPGRAAVVLVAAGLLATASPAAAGAQEGSRLPVAGPAPVPGGVRSAAPRPPGGRRPVGLLPLDPAARGLTPRPRPPKPRSLHDRHGLHALPFFFLPVLRHGLAAGTAGVAHGRRRPLGGSRPGGAGGPGDRPAGEEPGRTPPADAPRRPPGAPDDAGRPPPEGPCLEVGVRMENGATHRIRVDGGALEADAPRAAERKLRTRMASRGALLVEGLDGASLHLDADRVRGVSAERCPTIVVP